MKVLLLKAEELKHKDALLILRDYEMKKRTTQHKLELNPNA